MKVHFKPAAYAALMTEISRPQSFLLSSGRPLIYGLGEWDLASQTVFLSDRSRNRTMTGLGFDLSLYFSWSASSGIFWNIRCCRLEWDSSALSWSRSDLLAPERTYVSSLSSRSSFRISEISLVIEIWDEAWIPLDNNYVLSRVDIDYSKFKTFTLMSTSLSSIDCNLSSFASIASYWSSWDRNIVFLAISVIFVVNKCIIIGEVNRFSRTHKGFPWQKTRNDNKYIYISDARPLVAYVWRPYTFMRIYQLEQLRIRSAQI